MAERVAFTSLALLVMYGYINRQGQPGRFYSREIRNGDDDNDDDSWG